MSADDVEPGTDRMRDRLLAVGEAIARGSRRLERAGIDTARLEVRLLLGHVLRLPHLEVGLDLDRRLSPSESAAFLDLLDERCRRRPIQHLLGDVDFYGRTFRVGPGVLIPRPETESLIEAVLGRLAAGRGQRIAEVGCGSGIIAVTIAAERPSSALWCTDTSRSAVHHTRLNAAAHGVAGRVHACLADLLSPWSPARRFDAVVSNPPYVPTATIEALAPEVRDHDPRSALDGGADGLDIARRLLAAASGHLVEGGWIILELGYDQGERAADLARARDWVDIEVLPDLAGRDRVLAARRSRGG